MKTKQYYIMTDNSLSPETCNKSSLPAISDYDGLEQNTDDHNTLETNLNVHYFYQKPNSMKDLLFKPIK